MKSETEKERERLRRQTEHRTAAIEAQMRDAQLFGNKEAERKCSSWLKYLQRIENFLRTGNLGSPREPSGVVRVGKRSDRPKGEVFSEAGNEQIGRDATRKTVYIAGKITGDAGYKEKFDAVEKELLSRGWRVLNPAKLPELPYEQYYPINCAMIDGADAVYFLRDWTESPGAVKEFCYAGRRDIEILFEREEML